MHIPGFSVPDPSVPLEQASRRWNNDVNQPPNSSATASSETAGESQNGVNHFTRISVGVNYMLYIYMFVSIYNGMEI